MLRPAKQLALGVTLTTHGFRTTFVEWCARVDFETAQAALAHVIGQQVDRAYDRGDRFDLPKPVMEAWAQFCEPSPPVEVIRIEDRAAA